MLELPRAATKRTKRGGGGGGNEGVGVGLGAAVGGRAAEDLLAQLAHGGAVDEHLADQLVVSFF